MPKTPFGISPDDFEYSDSFSIIHSEILDKKDAFKEFLLEGYQLVKNRQEKLDAQLNELYKKDDESGEIFAQQGHYLGTVVNYTLQETFLLSATSYLFSQFEFSLREIAQKTAELFKLKMDVEKYVPKKRKRKKKKLSKIDRFLFFTDETSNINISDLNIEWCKIKLFQQARNCITHANGYVGINYPKLKELPKSTKGLSYDADNNRISLDNDYLIEMSKTCFDFLNKIMEKAWANRPKT